MKRSQRQHLKEDEFIATLQDTFARMDEHRRQITWAVVLLVVAGLAIGGFSWWRQQTNAKASALLAEAMTVAEAPVADAPKPGSEQQTAAPQPPAPGAYPNERARLEAALKKYMAAADAYPSTRAGIAARYAAASALVDLGRVADAERQYQQVIDKAGDGVYGRMARLGLAEAQTRQGKYDPAISTFKEMAATAKDLPTDAILMQLGRTYVAAGRRADASQTFKRVTDEFPNSPYLPEARQQLDRLKG